jgi:hypothetical protein
MACSGSHCSEHGTGTTTCAGHRASCSTNRQLTFTSYTQNGLIRAEDVNALRTAIRDEVARYNLHRSFDVTQRQATAYTTSTQVSSAHINDMETMSQQVNNVNEPVGTSYAVLTDPADATTAPNSYSANSRIDFSHWNTLLSKYNTMRQDCICNADCACNLVCSCHNDCGCNYSDERLKENIEYVETKNGLNLYKFNYIWDRVTKHIGVMAQEVLNTEYAQAVSKDSQGFYKVNYSKLPL